MDNERGYRVKYRERIDRLKDRKREKEGDTEREREEWQEK